MTEQIVVNTLAIMGLVGFGLALVTLFIWMWVLAYDFYKTIIKEGEK